MVEVTLSRKSQLIMLTVATYASTLASVFFAIKSSGSYLQVTIKLTQGINIVILSFFTLLNGVFVWKFLTHLLFGELRLIEYEHILERLPLTVINMVFMSSMFKGKDIIFTSVVFGIALLFMNVFIWILKDRLEALMQSINDTTTMTQLLFKNRFLINMIAFGVVDYMLMSNCITNSLLNFGGASSSVYLFLSMQFAVLLVELLNLFLHACLNFFEFYKSTTSHQELDIRGDDDEEEEQDNFIDDDDDQFNGLEGKFMYEKSIDIFTRVLIAIIHVLMLIPFRTKMLLLKDVIWDFISIYKTSSSLWTTWRNNKLLDDKLPTVSLHDLKTKTDSICIVCMDDLLPISEKEKDTIEEEKEKEIYNHIASSKQKPKMLPCAHVLHLHCLKNWMERSQTCPICRLPVFDDKGNVLPSQNAAGTSNDATPSESDSPILTDSSVSVEYPVEQDSSDRAHQQNVGTENIEPTLNGEESVEQESEELLSEEVGEVGPETANLSNFEQTSQEFTATSREALQTSNHPSFNSQTWHSFPIVSSTKNSISFNIKAAADDSKRIPVKLVATDKIPQQENEDEVTRVIIKDNQITLAPQDSTIKSLTNRIKELEDQIGLLSSKIETKVEEK